MGENGGSNPSYPSDFMATQRTRLRPVSPTMDIITFEIMRLGVNRGGKRVVVWPPIPRLVGI